MKQKNFNSMLLTLAVLIILSFMIGYAVGAITYIEKYQEEIELQHDNEKRFVPFERGLYE